MAKPVEVEVDSNFNNLRAFYERMAKLPRIVSISDFKINQVDTQSSESFEKAAKVEPQGNYGRWSKEALEGMPQPATLAQ